MTSLRSARPKRKRTVNVHLSKLELQEYLDDGYTVADIARDCNVDPAAINEKIRKLGIKKPRGTRREATSRRKPSSPRGRPPRDFSKRPGVSKSPRRSSPRRASRSRTTPSKKPGPKKRATGPAKTRNGSQSKTSNKKEEGDSQEENDPSLNTVVVQVIKDNPNDDIDQIHSILKWMGFDFDKSYVEEHMQKTVITEADKKVSESRKGKASDGDGETKGKSKQVSQKGQRRRGRPRKEAASTGEGKKETVVKKEEDSVKEDAEDENKEKKEPSKADEEPQEESREEKEGKVTTEEGHLSSSNKQSVSPPATEDGTETSKESKEGKEDANEKPEQPEGGKKKRPVRTRRKPKKIKDESECGDGATEAGEDSTTDAGTEDKESDKSVKPKKRGRKRKQPADKVDGVYMTKRGRPSLMLSEENLKHCMDSGLPRQKIAEVFGTCMRSISRYLELHKMRKSDKFCNCTDAELDEMVSKICKEHPDWGQLHIQKDLEKKGLYFRRAQIRNSVRRVDPIGIELRKLNNLKRRWNRGSLKKLNTILPADGINMTSTYSFLCQPPRTGLNGLSQEDSVRLLKDIVYSSKREYVEYPPPFKTEEEPAEESKAALADSSSSEERTDSGPMETTAQPSSTKEAAESSSTQPSTDSPSKGTSTEPSLMETSEQSLTEESAELSMDVSAELSSKESADELIKAVQMVEIKPEDQAPPEKTEEQQPPACAESPNKETTPSAGEAATAPDLDEYWKKRLQNMVMSNRRAGRQVAAQRRGPEIKIPKEELQECMSLGYSSTRIANKFNTSKHNVRKHLDLYKLGKARRFEILTDDSIDALVTSVIREHSVLKGRDVYDKIKESGLQIRKEDIRKSLCRLHPKGLHRGDPSILKKNWEEVAKQEGEVTYVMQEQRAIVDGNEEDVIVLNTDELAKLINHEGGIVLVDEHGNIMNASEEGYHHQQQQDGQGEADGTATMHHHQEGVHGTQEEPRQENIFVNSHQQYNTNSEPAADGSGPETVAYQYQGHSGEETGSGSEGAQQINQTFSTTMVTDNRGLSDATEHSATETATTEDSIDRVATDPQSDSGRLGTGIPSGDEQVAAVDALVEAHKDSQAAPTSQENEISAIILEFNVPHEQGEGAPSSGQFEQLAATQQHSQEVYFVQGEQENEEISRLVVVNDSKEKVEDTTEGDQKQEHIIMQVTDGASITEDGSVHSSSLTSLNTVQPNQLSAQVLLQLDRIAQNLHTQEVKEEPVPVSAETSSSP